MVANLPLLWGFFVVVLDGANAVAEFNVLYSPPSLKFSGHSKTLEIHLNEVLSASLGLPIDENTEWKGLYVLDPFYPPEAAVHVHIEGISSLGNQVGVSIQPGLKTTSYPLVIDEYEPELYENVKHRIKQKYTQGGSKLINIKLCNRQEFTSPDFVDVFGVTTIPKVSKQRLEHLKYFIEVDYQFLNELQALNAITNRVLSGAIIPDHIVDFYYFQFCSLRNLCDHHGSRSFQMKEAKTMLSNALQELSQAFVKAYDGSVIVTTIATEIRLSQRQARSPDDQINPGDNDLNMNLKTMIPHVVRTNGQSRIDADFPVMFNIFLWFGLMYIFSIIAIIYVLINMDPGRDSIIYRMTNTRLKKDV